MASADETRIVDEMTRIHARRKHPTASDAHRTFEEAERIDDTKSYISRARSHAKVAAAKESAKKPSTRHRSLQSASVLRQSTNASDRVKADNSAWGPLLRCLQKVMSFKQSDVEQAQTQRTKANIYGDRVGITFIPVDPGSGDDIYMCSKPFYEYVTRDTEGTKWDANRITPGRLSPLTFRPVWSPLELFQVEMISASGGKPFIRCFSIESLISMVKIQLLQIFTRKPTLVSKEQQTRVMSDLTLLLLPEYDLVVRRLPVFTPMFRHTAKFTRDDPKFVEFIHKQHVYGMAKALLKQFSHDSAEFQTLCDVVTNPQVTARISSEFSMSGRWVGAAGESWVGTAVEKTRIYMSSFATLHNWFYTLLIINKVICLLARVYFTWLSLEKSVPPSVAVVLIMNMFGSLMGSSILGIIAFMHKYYTAVPLLRSLAIPSHFVGVVSTIVASVIAFLSWYINLGIIGNVLWYLSSAVLIAALRKVCIRWFGTTFTWVMQFIAFLVFPMGLMNTFFFALNLAKYVLNLIFGQTQWTTGFGTSTEGDRVLLMVVSTVADYIASLDLSFVGEIGSITQSVGETFEILRTYITSSFSYDVIKAVGVTAGELTIIMTGLFSREEISSAAIPEPTDEVRQSDIIMKFLYGARDISVTSYCGVGEAMKQLVVNLFESLAGPDESEYLPYVTSIIDNLGFVLVGTMVAQLILSIAAEAAFIHALYYEVALKGLNIQTFIKDIVENNFQYERLINSSCAFRTIKDPSSLDNKAFVAVEPRVVFDATTMTKAEDFLAYGRAGEVLWSKVSETLLQKSRDTV